MKTVVASTLLLIAGVAIAYGSCTIATYPNGCFAYTACPTEVCCPSSGCSTAITCACNSDVHGGAQCCASNCAVTCYSTPSHDCDLYYECKAKIGAPTLGATTLSVLNKSGRAIPIVVGYSKDVLDRGGVRIDGIRAQFKEEEIDMAHAVGIGPVPQGKRFLNFWWTATNTTGREITAMLGEIQLDWVEKKTGKIWSNVAMFGKDYWQGRAFRFTPGTMHEELGGKIMNGDGAVKITIRISFVEFDDGDRIGDEFLISAQRINWLGGYRSVVARHYQGGVADEKLIDSIRPQESEGYDAMSMWNYLKQRAEDVGIADLIKEADATVADWRVPYIQEGVGRFEAAKAECNAKASAKVKGAN